MLPKLLAMHYAYKFQYGSEYRILDELVTKLNEYTVSLQQTDAYCIVVPLQHHSAYFFTRHHSVESRFIACLLRLDRVPAALQKTDILLLETAGIDARITGSQQVFKKAMLEYVAMAQ